MPAGAEVWAELNGRREVHTLADLRAGARAGRLGKIDSPSYRFHRAPAWGELAWQAAFEDAAPSRDGTDVYYLRVRQSNDEWAWSSPIWVSAEA